MEKDELAPHCSRWSSQHLGTYAPDGSKWVFIVRRMKEEFVFAFVFVFVFAFVFVIFNWNDFKRDKECQVTIEGSTFGVTVVSQIIACIVEFYNDASLQTSADTRTYIFEWIVHNCNELLE
jgi:hypothetical protein